MDEWNVCEEMTEKGPGKRTLASSHGPQCNGTHYKAVTETTTSVYSDNNNSLHSRIDITSPKQRLLM